MLLPLNGTSTAKNSTLSLHDALPISALGRKRPLEDLYRDVGLPARYRSSRDRKSTRLNSSHVRISYAVFCLKKKKLLGEFHTMAVIMPRDFISPINAELSTCVFGRVA